VFFAILTVVGLVLMPVFWYLIDSLVDRHTQLESEKNIDVRY
jgi:hypothetical protein